MDISETNLGREIRAAREKAVVSQGALARVLGLWQSQISAFESGTRVPSIEQLLALLEELAVPEKARYAFFVLAARRERELRAEAAA